MISWATVYEAKDGYPHGFVPTETIDEVVDRLARIVVSSRSEGTRHGWFASLYLRTTLQIRSEIRRDRFEDGARMERFGAHFANRYLAARYRYRWRDHGEPTQAWRLAFDRENEPGHLVLQYLMLGMNTHINLDLAIAASATCPGSEIHDLKADFFEVNRLLPELIDSVQIGLAGVSPWLVWVDRLGGRGDAMLVGAFLRASRRFAWRRAVRLAPLADDALAVEVRGLDLCSARLGRRICSTWRSQPSWLRALCERERSDVDAVYEALARGINPRGDGELARLKGRSAGVTGAPCALQPKEHDPMRSPLHEVPRACGGNGGRRGHQPYRIAAGAPVPA